MKFTNKANNIFQRSIIECFIFFISTFYLFSQTQKPQSFEQNITASNLKQYVSVLTADSMMGRSLYTGGETKSGNYIANFFKEINLNNPNINNYHQCFDVYSYNYNGKTSLNEKEINDFVFWGYDTSVQWNTLPVYFAGYHQTLPDSVKNHAVIVFAMDISDMIQSIQKLRENKNNNVYLLFFGDDSYTYQYISKSYWSYTNQTFNKKNNIFHIAFRPLLENDRDLKLFFFNDKTFKEVTGTGIRKVKKQARTAKEMNKPESSAFSTMDFKYKINTVAKNATSCNILGFIEGTTHKDEVIVVGAHYDHLGINKEKKIYYGADDNASGTAALMSIAQCFMNASKNNFQPKRTVLFIAFGSEEAGLLGSEYYVENPLFPLNQTVAVINMDMIGRGDKHLKKENFVYAKCYGKNTKDLKKTVKEIDKNSDIKIKNPPFQQTILYRYGSDHYNFAKNDIPSFVFFTGTHDDYHTINDTPEKLNYKNMEKISRFVFRLAFDLSK